MIVVTGATGNMGRPLVRALAAAGTEVTAVSRKISPADVPDGVRHHQADLTEPDTLAPVLAGADALYLLTSADFALAGGDLAGTVDAARAAGVRRLVLLSSQGVATNRHPTDYEDQVRNSGLQWTMLRPGAFASNAFQWAESVHTQRVAAAPFADVALPVVDPDDIAEVAAAVLRDPSHTGQSYTLTGPAPISPRQQVKAVADALGEPIRFVEQTRAEAKALMTQFMPDRVADTSLDILGDPSPAEQRVSPDIERVLGRPAHPFANWATRNITAFK